MSAQICGFVLALRGKAMSLKSIRLLGGWRRMLVTIERLICVAGSAPMAAIDRRTTRLNFRLRPPMKIMENNGSRR
jgi:hypothetical protein